MVVFSTSKDLILHDFRGSSPLQCKKRAVFTSVGDFAVIDLHFFHRTWNCFHGSISDAGGFVHEEFLDVTFLKERNDSSLFEPGRIGSYSRAGECIHIGITFTECNES